MSLKVQIIATKDHQDLTEQVNQYLHNINQSSVSIQYQDTEIGCSALIAWVQE